MQFSKYRTCQQTILFQSISQCRSRVIYYTISNLFLIYIHCYKVYILHTKRIFWKNWGVWPPFCAAPEYVYRRYYVLCNVIKLFTVTVLPLLGLCLFKVLPTILEIQLQSMLHSSCEILWQHSSTVEVLQLR